MTEQLATVRALESGAVFETRVGRWRWRAFRDGDMYVVRPESAAAHLQHLGTRSADAWHAVGEMAFDGGWIQLENNGE